MNGNKTKAYKISLISNRRYLKNKCRIFPFAADVVLAEHKGIKTVADIFAGTGAVSSAFTDKIIITNDLMHSNYICCCIWFGAESCGHNGCSGERKI